MMNERIRELILQAREETREGKWKPPTAVWTERFAELIVKECVELGKELQTQDVINGSEDYKSGREMGIEVFMNQIKKNFGVE